MPVADAPNTLTNIATSYLSLVPFNYNDYDVSLESRNSILINEDYQWIIQEGITSQASCVPPAVPFVMYHDTERYDELGRPVKMEVIREQGGEGTPMRARVKMKGDL